MVGCGRPRVVRRGRIQIDDSTDVVIGDQLVSISALLVGEGGQRGARRRRVVRSRSTRRLDRARDMDDEASGVAAAAPRVHNEGRTVEPRRSERRYHVPNVGAAARGVVARGLWVPKNVSWVSDGVWSVSDGAPGLAREG